MKPIDIKAILLEEYNKLLKEEVWFDKTIMYMESDVSLAVYWPVRNCLLDGVMK